MTKAQARFRHPLLFRRLLYCLSSSPQPARRSFLLAAPVFFIIDHAAGMPFYRTLPDAAGCGFFGAALLWLTRRDAGHNE
jgi:hypothetical protein